MKGNGSKIQYTVKGGKFTHVYSLAALRGNDDDNRKKCVSVRPGA